jgi:hypothetical protein
MDSIFITAVQNLILTEPIGRFEVCEGLCLLNDRQKFRELITPEFAAAMGSLEYHHLIDNGYGFYAKCKNIPYSAEDLVKIHLDLVHLFFHALWLVKDHAVRCELAFVELSQGSRRTRSSNFRAILYCKADGSSDPTKFSLAELRGARKWLEEFLLPMYPEESIDEENVSVVSHKSIPRLTRVFFFVSSARGSSDLGVKIALYTTCLEIIFSTSPSELAHRMSERVAWTLCGSATEREEMYSFLKRAYDVRSKIVHGDVLSDEKAKDLPIVSSRLDDVTRRVLTKVFTTPNLRSLLSKKTDELDDFYLRLVLGSERSVC